MWRATSLHHLTDLLQDVARSSTRIERRGVSQALAKACRYWFAVIISAAMCRPRRQQQTQTNHQDQILHGSWLCQKPVSQDFWMVEMLSPLLYSGGGAGVHEWSFYKQSTDLGSPLRSRLNKMLNNKRLVNWSQSSSPAHRNSSHAQQHLVVIVRLL